MVASKQHKMFTPHLVKKVTFRNRFVLPAMQRGWGNAYAPTDRLCDFYRRAAQGGVSLVITEAIAVNHPSATGHPAFVLMLNKGNAAALGKCIDAVHEEGGRIFLQLWHEGATRKQFEGGLDPSYPTLSPSGLIRAGAPNGDIATIEQLRAIRDAYVENAIMAKELGADGIEIHGAHGYFLDLFLWPETNLRTDAYGGPDIVSRTQYPAEIVRHIRAAVGEDFLICFRFSQWKEVDYHGKNFTSPEELRAMLDVLQEAGTDIFHASARWFDRPEWPDKSSLGIAGWTKTLTGATVIAVGSVGLNVDGMDTLYTDKVIVCEAESAIEKVSTKMDNREFDMIAVGRSLMADPHWVNKVFEDRYSDIIPFRREYHKEAVSTWDDSGIRGSFQAEIPPSFY